MMKEGLPEPSRFLSSIDTGSIDQHSDVLQRILKNERQVDEKPQRDKDTISPETFSSYVRTWYAFYSADPPFLQISLFFMHLHRPPEYRFRKYRCIAYCPVVHRPTAYRPTDLVEHRPSDYRPTDYRTTAFCFTDYRSTEYRNTVSQLSDYCHTEYRPTKYRYTAYCPAVEHRPTDYRSTDLLSTNYRSTVPITDLRLLVLLTTVYRILNYCIPASRLLFYRLPSYSLLTSFPTTVLPNTGLLIYLHVYIMHICMSSSIGAAAA